MKYLNGFYITNLDDTKQGGLFHATYERIKRHNVTLNEIKIINNNFNLKEKECYKYQNIKISNLNYKRNLVYVFDKFIKHRQERRLVLYYFFKYEKQLSRADFIHAHWGWPNGFLAFRLAEKLSIPYFITFHGSDINNLKKRNIKNMLLAMENATACFFVSNALLKEAINKGYSGKNALVNYNGVDLNEFKLKVTRTKTIGYVGDLIEKKGADLLPSIFKNINEINNDYSFKIIGDGPLKNDIAENIKHFNLSHKVEFLGEIPKVKIPEVMRDLDLLIVPSKMEGLGMVILEAHASGVPVVGSNRGGIPEAIDDRKFCFPINEHFVNNLSKQAVNTLENNNYEINSIKLRERIDEKFSWDKIVNQEYKAYKKSFKP